MAEVALAKVQVTFRTESEFDAKGAWRATCLLMSMDGQGERVVFRFGMHDPHEHADCLN